MAPPSFTLFRGFPSSTSYVWSPFATKLEARFRFAGLAYRTDAGAPPTAPRGKIPYLAISATADAAPDTVSDTALISERLVAEGLAADLNGTITAAERAQDLALRALLEDKLYFYQVRGFLSFGLPPSSPPFPVAPFQTERRLPVRGPRLTATAAATRATSAGSRITTRCGPRSSRRSRTPRRCSSGSWRTARCRRRSGARGRGGSRRRKSAGSRGRCGRAWTRC